MNSEEFHLQSQEYQLSRALDKISGNKNREKIYLQGNTMPKWEPQGSFNRMSYGVPNVIEPAAMSGGSRSQLQQSAVQNQLNKRAQQLIEMTGTQDIDNLPGATQKRATPRASEKAELELFFTDLSSLNFTGNKIPMKEIKETIKNLRLSGLGLNKNTLIRFKDITEDAVNLFIQNIEQNKNLDFKTAFDGFRLPDEPEIFNFIQNLQTLPAFELLYKIYLILVSLINNYNLQLKDREQIFTQHYEEVLKATPRTLFDGKTKTAFDNAQAQVKELKEIMPADFYSAFFKKINPSVSNLIKIKPKNDLDSDDDSIIEVDANGNVVLADAGVEERKEANTEDGDRKEPDLDDLGDFEIESVEYVSDDEPEQKDESFETVDLVDEDRGVPKELAAKEPADLTANQIKKIKTKAHKDTKKFINSQISSLNFPMTNREEIDTIIRIYDDALRQYRSALAEKGIQLGVRQSYKKEEDFRKLINPVIERKNAMAAKPRKSPSKRAQKAEKQGKGAYYFDEDDFMEIFRLIHSS